MQNKRDNASNINAHDMSTQLSLLGNACTVACPPRLIKYFEVANSLFAKHHTAETFLFVKPPISRIHYCRKSSLRTVRAHRGIFARWVSTWRFPGVEKQYIVPKTGLSRAPIERRKMCLSVLRTITTSICQQVCSVQVEKAMYTRANNR